MPNLQLRVTLDPSANRTRDSVLGLINALLRKIRSWKLPDEHASFNHTCGYEEHNKYGEPCDPHFHLNVAWIHNNAVKDPLRQAKEFLKKTALNRRFQLRGNTVWSCTIVADPSDFARWLRYPLKEKPVKAFCHIDPEENFCTDLPPETPILTHLTALAKDERRRSIEANVLQREKVRDKSTFRDKIFKHLDQTDGSGVKHLHWLAPTGIMQFPEEKTIWISILKFYQSEKKAICFKTINGYTIAYQLYLGALSYDQAFDLRFNS